MTEHVDEAANGWARTLETANEMEARLEDEGWRVVTVRAGHVAPVSPELGDDDRFGFVYIAPGDVADPLTEAIDDGEFDGYEVFNRRVDADLFSLTRVVDSDRRIAILLVGGIDLTYADDLVATVRERDEMYSHVELLDGTQLGSFHHDDPSPFFPKQL